MSSFWSTAGKPVLHMLFVATYQHKICNPTRLLQGSPGLKGPEPQRVSETISKNSERLRSLSETLLLIISEPRGRKATRDSLGDSLGLRACRAVETPVKGGQGYNTYICNSLSTQLPTTLEMAGLFLAGIPNSYPIGSFPFLGL